MWNKTKPPREKRDEPRKEVDSKKHLPAVPPCNDPAAGTRGVRDTFDDQYARPVSQHDHLMAVDQATWVSHPTSEENRGSHHRQFKQTMRPGAGDRKEVPSNTGVRSMVRGVTEFFNPPISGPRYEGNHAYEEPRPQPRYPDQDVHNELHNRVLWLERENTSKQARIQELLTSLEKEKVSSQQVKLSADKMQLKLDNKDAFMGAQLSDEAIQEKFRQLFAAVKTWSTNFSGADYSRFEVKAESVTILRSVLPAEPIAKAVEALVTSRNRTLRRIFRGWIAELFCIHVFRSTDRDFASAPRDLWLDERASLDFSSLEDRLAYADRSHVSLRLLHDWRSFSAELLSRLAVRKEDEGDKEGFVRDLGDEFLRFACHWVPADRTSDVAKATHDLFMDAIKLSQLLRRQRAHWSVRNLHAIANRGRPRNEAGETVYRFDDRVMRDIDDEGCSPDGMNGSRQRVVDIFIEPALFKCGNADGEGFEIETCFAQTLVSCLD